MNRFLFAPTTFLVILLVFQMQIPVVRSEDDAEAEEGEDEGEESGPDDTCKKKTFNLIQGFLSAALNCLGGKLVLRSPFELSTRFYCVMKCTMQELGVIDPDGLLDEVAALFYFQDVIPKEISEVVIGGAQPCLALASQFIPKQYYCQSYAEFSTCVTRALISTYSPYALDCFGSPGMTFLFNFIDLMVPRAPASPASSSALRRLLTSQQRVQPRRRPSSNSTTLAQQRRNRNSSLVIPPNSLVGTSGKVHLNSSTKTTASSSPSPTAA